MLLLLLVQLASAGGKWDNLVADVGATLTVAAPQDKIFNYLLDLRNLKTVFPGDCVGRWEFGERTFGEGASAYVRYDMGLMHRRLPMTLAHAIGPSSIDFDHLGRRGFVTRWTLTEARNGTEVKILTALNPPPPLFRRYFYQTVQLEWKLCYQRALANLATEMAR